MNKSLVIFEPYTGKELSFVDTRPKPAACKPSFVHRPPFDVRRISVGQKSSDVAKVTLDAYSYLTAIEAVSMSTRAMRKAIDDRYVEILADIDDVELGQTVETILANCIDKNYDLSVHEKELDEELMDAIKEYRQLVANYFVSKPVLSVQPKADTEAGVDFGVFYGIPGQQPFQVGFRLQE